MSKSGWEQAARVIRKSVTVYFMSERAFGIVGGWMEVEILWGIQETRFIQTEKKIPKNVSLDFIYM